MEGRCDLNLSTPRRCPDPPETHASSPTDSSRWLFAGLSSPLDYTYQPRKRRGVLKGRHPPPVGEACCQLPDTQNVGFVCRIFFWHAGTYPVKVFNKPLYQYGGSACAAFQHLRDLALEPKAEEPLSLLSAVKHLEVGFRFDAHHSPRGKGHPCCSSS